MTPNRSQTSGGRAKRAEAELENADQFPFGSRSVGVLVDAIQAGYSAAEAGTLFLKTEVDRWAPDDYPNKATRLQRLFRAMRRDEDVAARRKGALELASTVLRENGPSSGYQEAGWWQGLRDALAADGWEWDESGQRLVASVSGVEVAEETSGLERDLRERSWNTAAGHYRQALDAFSRGEWSSSNAQLRSFVEALLPLVAEELTGDRPKKARAAIDVLRDETLVDGEFDLLKGLWAMLHHRGSHPGLSDEEEARYRVMVVTAQARFLLARL